jgi:hypothetical protein
MIIIRKIKGNTMERDILELDDELFEDALLSDDWDGEEDDVDEDEDDTDAVSDDEEEDEDEEYLDVDEELIDGQYEE